MGLENSGFGVVDGSGTRDDGHIGRGSIVRPRDLNSLGGGLCNVDRLLTTVGKFPRRPAKLWRGQRFESWLRFGVREVRV